MIECKVEVYKSEALLTGWKRLSRECAGKSAVEGAKGRGKAGNQRAETITTFTGVRLEFCHLRAALARIVTASPL